MIEPLNNRLRKKVDLFRGLFFIVSSKKIYSPFIQMHTQIIVLIAIIHMMILQLIHRTSFVISYILLVFNVVKEKTVCKHQNRVAHIQFCSLIFR